MTQFVGNRVTLPRLGTAPSSPAAGDMYYNTGDNKPYVHNGTSWVAATGTTGSGGNAVTYSADAPSSPAVGDIWVESDNDLAVVKATPDFFATFLTMGA